GYCDDVRQGHLLANNRVIIGKPLGVGSGRSAKAARGVGLATRVLHRVRAGVVAAQGDDDLAGAIDDHGGDGVTTALAAVDRRFRDRLGDGIGKVVVGDKLGVSERDHSAHCGADQNKTKRHRYHGYSASLSWTAAKVLEWAPAPPIANSGRITTRAIQSWINCVKNSLKMC